MGLTGNHLRNTKNGNKIIGIMRNCYSISNLLRNKFVLYFSIIKEMRRHGKEKEFLIHGKKIKNVMESNSCGFFPPTNEDRTCHIRNEMDRFSSFFDHQS